ncbi:hypothetical protein DFJ73DRAFT_780058 [Zopfochytrium polystomum]|nr:hypothetical protein DFJ73DRAFT_780058 [Zopfochytrium polystomum]
MLPVNLLNVLPSFARRLNELQLPMQLASVTLLTPLAAPNLLLGLKNTTDVLPHFFEHMLNASTFPTAKGSQFFMRIRGSLSSFTWTTFKAMYDQHFGLDSAFWDYTWSPSATSPAAALTDLELLNSHQSEPHGQRGIKKQLRVTAGNETNISQQDEAVDIVVSEDIVLAPNHNVELVEDVSEAPPLPDAVKDVFRLFEEAEEDPDQLKPI